MHPPLPGGGPKRSEVAMTGAGGFVFLSTSNLLTVVAIMNKFSGFTKFAVAALALGTSVLGVQAHADTLAQIQAKKSVNIGVSSDFAPYAFMNPNMQLDGLDIEVAKLVAKKLGVKLNFVQVTVPNRVAYLQSNKVDMIISTLGKTPERAKVIDYTIAYSPYFSAIYAPKSEKITSYADLAGKTVAVTKGTIQDGILVENAPKSVDIRRFDDNAATIAAAASGQMTIVASSIAVINSITQMNPKINLVFKLMLKNSPDYIGIQKGNTTLLDKVNEILKQAKADGTLNALSEKWLKQPAGDLPE